ncbi:MAG: AAA family ATPase [Lachnospiraceae bacterium]|nr:AAA family ATPase [Lachnospiraceae bacterium]
MADKKNTFDPTKSLEDLLKETQEITDSLREKLSGSSRIDDTIKNVYSDFFGKDFQSHPDYMSFKEQGVVSDFSDSASAPAAAAAPEAHSENETQTAAAVPGAETEKPKEPEKTGMEELNELVGLEAVKHDVKELTAFVKMQKLREKRGMKTPDTSLHLVFSGNPGTGKTTIARILAKIYKEIGALSKGQLVEVDRGNLVAGYVGQTAIKTKKKIEEAKGGILFIDEAYTLARGEGNDFGQEAIDTILKAMEDNRDDLVVIVAGYTDLMKKFINSNPGLKSRFNKYIEFPDYSAEELIAIFNLRCDKYGYSFTPEARRKVDEIITAHEKNKGPNFANARDVRNLFEKIITNQATRIAELAEPTDEDLTTITEEDLGEGL